MDSTPPPRHLELDPVVLRHPDPGRVAPPAAPPGRLLTWTAYASAGLILLFGISVVYVIAARAFPGAAAPDPVVATAPSAVAASATPPPASPAAAAPAVVGTPSPGHCPAAVQYGGTRPGALPRRAPTRVTVCRYRFPTAGADPGTLVGTPAEGKPRDFDAAARTYAGAGPCRPSKPAGEQVTVDVVSLGYGGTPVVWWLVRAPCADAGANDPAAALHTAVDNLLGPP